MGKTVNKRELADILGKSERTLTDWQASAGLPVEERGARGEENAYDTEKVIAWYVQRELARANVETPRDRLDRIRAQREELGLRRDLGELVNVELIEPMLDRYVQDVANAVDGLAEKYALMLQQVTDPEGQHQLLALLAREIRDALGNYDFAPAAAKAAGGDRGVDGGDAASDHPALPSSA